MTHPLAALIAGVQTHESREKIDARADELFRARNRQRGAISLNTIEPQSYRDYFVVDATVEAVLAALEAAPDLVEAGKVADRLENADPFQFPFSAADAELAAADTIRALIALCQAQAAQIAGLEAQLTNTLFEAECEGEDKRDAAYSAAEWQRSAEAAEAKVAELEAQIVAEKEENRWAYIQAALDDNKADAEAKAATLRDEVERLRGAIKRMPKIVRRTTVCQGPKWPDDRPGVWIAALTACEKAVQDAVDAALEGKA